MYNDSVINLDVHGVSVKVIFVGDAVEICQFMLADFHPFWLYEDFIFPADLTFLVACQSDGIQYDRRGIILIEFQNEGDFHRSWVRHVRPRFTPRITEVIFKKIPSILVHASAASLDGNAVAFLGEKGAGKSSLCYLLVKDGWRYLSNDLLYLAMRDNVRCLGMPQELTLGGSARIWFDNADGPLSPSLIEEMVRMHGEDSMRKISYRHDVSIMEKDSNLKCLIFPEPAIEDNIPSLRILNAGEMAQKLIANTQTCVRWGFSSDISVEHYISNLQRVVTGIMQDQSINCYLFRWCWDHKKNKDMLRGIL